MSGADRGLDHVIIFVRDLEATRDSYRKLGFAVPSADEIGILPSGFRFGETYFAHTHQYLEWRAIHDFQEAARSRPRFVRFVERFEGALTLVVAVESVHSTAEFLRARGFQVTDPQPAPWVVDREPVWWYIAFANFFLPIDPSARSEASPSRIVSFSSSAVLAKIRAQVRAEKWPRQPNTARALRAAWIAVSDVGTVAREYEAIGLQKGEIREVPVLGAAGCEIEADRGDLLLLQPRDATGPVASFLAGRGEGLMGVSIEVDDLTVAHELLERNTGRVFPRARGPYGESVIIPPDLTHGVWLDLFQSVAQ